MARDVHVRYRLAEMIIEEMGIRARRRGSLPVWFFQTSEGEPYAASCLTSRTMLAGAGRQVRKQCLLRVGSRALRQARIPTAVPTDRASP